MSPEAQPGYPFEVRLRVHRVANGQLVEDSLEIVPAGRLTTGQVVEAHLGGEPVLVEFADDAGRAVDVDFIRGDERHRVSLRTGPPLGVYYVGLSLTGPTDVELLLRHPVRGHITSLPLDGPVL